MRAAGAGDHRPANHNSRLRPPAQQRRAGRLQAGGGPRPRPRSPLPPGDVRSRGHAGRAQTLRRVPAYGSRLRESRRSWMESSDDPLNSATTTRHTFVTPCHSPRPVHLSRTSHSTLPVTTAAPVSFERPGPGARRLSAARPPTNY